MSHYAMQLVASPVTGLLQLRVVTPSGSQSPPSQVARMLFAKTLLQSWPVLVCPQIQWSHY